MSGEGLLHAPFVRRGTLLLADIERFSRDVLGMPLRPYQLQPLAAVLDSVLHGRGLEFLLVFSRQSGKNEAIAHLLVYLLNLYRRQGGSMVFAAAGDGLGRGRQRLAARLNNPWNRHDWHPGARPSQIRLGSASVAFVSSHPLAAARGETAGLLLIVDELQDQDPQVLESVFTPMRAAGNATAVYLGTVRTRHDALWRKKEELERLQSGDGRRRVFWAGPAQITAANPAYARFLEDQIARHGRGHPTIASEYFLEPLDGAGGLFPARRLALMRGDHPRLRLPGAGLYAALLDVGGQDEAPSGGGLQNTARDYTVCTIVRVVSQSGDDPRYEAVDVFVAHGDRFFDGGQSPALAGRLRDYLLAWQVIHLVGDATGVGEGLLDWLAARIGKEMVTHFKFTRPSKAALGAAFLALIESGRFAYWGDDADEPGSDGWWFFQQAAHCVYDLPPGGAMERDLRWYVPEGMRVSAPTGRTAVHDDRLLSAALVAELDRLRRSGAILLGEARSAVIERRDPLLPDEFW